MKKSIFDNFSNESIVTTKLLRGILEPLFGKINAIDLDFSFLKSNIAL